MTTNPYDVIQAVGRKLLHPSDLWMSRFAFRFFQSLIARSTFPFCVSAFFFLGWVDSPLPDRLFVIRLLQFPLWTLDVPHHHQSVMAFQFGFHQLSQVGSSVWDFVTTTLSITAMTAFPQRYIYIKNGFLSGAFLFRFMMMVTMSGFLFGVLWERQR